MDNITKSILKFIIKSLAVTLPVIAIAIMWYVATDPFKVVRHYNCYLPDPIETPVRVGINKGLITLTNFNDRLSEGYSYNAFIFGSSVSCYYDAVSWAHLADSTGKARPYHFDSSGESLMAMADKVEYLDRTGQPIDYAMIVLDPIVMSANQKDGPSDINPPQLMSGLIEFLKYHYIFFRASTNADFFKSWIPAMLTGKPCNNGHNRVFEPQPIVYDPLINQESLPQWDSIISANPVQFYSLYPLVPSPNSITINDVVLTTDKIEALHRIERVFTKHNTDYHIIIGPNRRKVVINPVDLDTIINCFSAPNRIHDFSLSKAHILESDTLLYDNTHYRSTLALWLMQEAYRKSNIR